MHRIHMDYITPIRHIGRWWIAIAVVIIIWLGICVKEWNHHRYVKEHPEEINEFAEKFGKWIDNKIKGEHEQVGNL